MASFWSGFPRLPPFTSSSLPSLSPNAEAHASFLSRISFHWIHPLIIRGSRQPLQQSDLPQLAEPDQSATTAPIFARTYRLVTAADITRRALPYKISHLLTCAKSTPCPSNAYPPSRLARLAQLCPPFIIPPRTLRALIPVTFAPFLRAAALKPIWLAASIAQSFCIRALVDRVAQSDHNRPNLSSRWAFIPVILALTLAAQIMSVSTHAVFAGSMRAGMRARAALSSQIYRKTLRLSPSSLSSVSEGEIANLLVNDTQRVLDSYTYANFCWTGFFEIAVITALLTIDLGISALFAVAVLILLVPAQIFFSVSVSRARATVSVEADKRVQTMNELLSAIRIIKLSAWEAHFNNVVAQQRAQEIRHHRSAAVLRALNAALFFVAPVLVALATFTAHTLIFRKPLTPAVVFSTLAFFNTLASVLRLMPPGWLAISEAIVAGRRLDSFFDLPESLSVPNTERLDLLHALDVEQPEDSALSEITSHADTFSDVGDASSEDQPRGSDALTEPHVILTNAHFSFARSDEKAQAAVLTDINMTLTSRELVCVIGPVGSGKSSLLLGILDELQCTGGFIQKHGRTAYCAQEPWIVNGTLRDNITMFGVNNNKDFDSVWYDMVVEACCLRTDIDTLPAGDFSEIGERGVNLSGGQKARVSLARAAYANADVYLLDDPLSAVDSAVTARLIQRLFSKNGLLAEKAQVVVTHQLKLLPLSTRIIVLGEGTIQHIGTFKELRDKGFEFSGLTKSDDNIAESPEYSQGIEELDGSQGLHESDINWKEKLWTKAEVRLETSHVVKNTESISGGLKKKANIDECGSVDKSEDSDDSGTYWSSTGKGSEDIGDLVEEEDRCVGRVTSSVYKAYIKAGGGYFAFFMVLVSFAVPQALRQAADWWLSRWSTHPENDNFLEENRFHALVFLGLTLGTAVLTLLRAAIFARQTMTASRRIHDQLLDRILRVRPSFFETNPLGRILNRFSKDVDNMDIKLPETTQDCLQIFFVAFGALAAIAVILPWFLIPLVPIIAIFLALQRLYKMTSRELKRIDGLSRSPIYSQFVESAHGLATIRAHKYENQLYACFDEYIDKNNSAYHMFTCAGRWLGIRLDALAAIVIFFTGLVVIIVGQTLNPGLAGVALTQSVLITGILQCTFQTEDSASFFVFPLAPNGYLTILTICHSLVLISCARRGSTASCRDGKPFHECGTHHNHVESGTNRETVQHSQQEATFTLAIRRQNCI